MASNYLKSVRITAPPHCTQSNTSCLPSTCSLHPPRLTTDKQTLRIPAHLPSTCSLTMLPATRTTNRSPKPCRGNCNAKSVVARKQQAALGACRLPGHCAGNGEIGLCSHVQGIGGTQLHGPSAEPCPAAPSADCSAAAASRQQGASGHQQWHQQRQACQMQPKIPLLAWSKMSSGGMRLSLQVSTTALGACPPRSRSRSCSSGCTHPCCWPCRAGHQGGMGQPCLRQRGGGGATAAAGAGLAGVHRACAVIQRHGMMSRYAWTGASAGRRPVEPSRGQP